MKKYNLDDEANGSHRWGNEFIVASLMNITRFFFCNRWKRFQLSSFTQSNIPCGDAKESYYHKKIARS